MQRARGAVRVDAPAQLDMVAPLASRLVAHLAYARPSHLMSLSRVAAASRAWPGLTLLQYTSRPPAEQSDPSRTVLPVRHDAVPRPWQYDPVGRPRGAVAPVSHVLTAARPAQRDPVPVVELAARQ